MEPEQTEFDAISQALDYIADQSYSDEQLKLLGLLFADLSVAPDLDAVKNVFSDVKGVYSRIQTVFSFAEKYKNDNEMMDDLGQEIEFLMGMLQGTHGGGLSF